MDGISSLTDREVDELLAGRPPSDRDDLAPVAEVTAAARSHAASERAPVMSYPLRHALARAASPIAPRRPRAVGPAAVAAAITLVVLSGAAQALPAPMQAAVADMGQLVGVALPHPAGPQELSTPAPATPITITVAEAEDEGSEPKVQRAPTIASPVTPVDPVAGGREAEDPGEASVPPRGTAGEDRGDAPTGTGPAEEPTDTSPPPGIDNADGAGGGASPGGGAPEVDEANPQDQGGPPGSQDGQGRRATVGQGDLAG